jgi:predicted ATPase
VYDRVFFSADSSVRGGLSTGDILIFPALNSWNDFGYQTLCEYEVIGEEIGGLFRLAFLDTPEKSVRDYLEKKLGGLDSPTLSEKLPQFFSLMTEMDSYRDLVTRLSPEKAKRLLLALNDLVAARAFEPTPYWLPEALVSPHLGMSILRTSESNFVYHNAATVLGGVEFEDVSAAASKIALNFRLNGFDSDHSFEFNFTPQSLPPKRIAVLIGKNGVGKSRTLNRLVTAALEITPNDSSLSLSDGAGALPRLSRILAVCTPGESEATFPEEPAIPARFVYKRIRAEAKSGPQTLSQILLSLSRDRRQIGPHFRWRIFEASVEQILSFSELVLETRVEEAIPRNEIHLYRLWHGGEQASAEARVAVDPWGNLKRRVNGESVPLSSGQQSFIRMAAQLCTYIENGSLLLMDEPETHLHPNLITSLVAMLDRVLSLTGSIALVATHSAYLVREVPQSQVHIIRERDYERKVEVVRPRLKTFGADVGAISHFVFGDDIVNRLIVQLEERLGEDPVAAQHWLESIEAELSMEAVMALRREIEKRKAQKK